MKITSYDTFQAASNAVKSIDLKQNTEKTEKSTVDLEDLSKLGQKAVKLLDEMGVSLSDKDAKVIDKFMQEASGSVEEKLAALSTAIQKELPLTKAVISDFSSSRQCSLVDFIQTAEPAKKAISGGAINKEVDGKRSIKLANKIDKLLSEFLSEKDTQQSKVKKNPDFNKVVSSKFTYDSDEAIDEDFVTNLKNFVEQLVEESLDFPAEMMFNQPLTKPAQMFLEEKVTPRLAEVKRNFEQFKADVLSSIKDIIEPEKMLKPEQKAEALSKIIDKLDSAIMKSEIGLFVDMSTEKMLLKQSSALADARELLSKGQLTESEKIVQQVFKVIDELDFKPTIQKAIAVGNPFNLDADNLKYEQILKWAKGSVGQFVECDKSTAVLVNYLRRLGINHEAEVFQKVFDQNQRKEQAPRDLQNLKSMLLSLAKEGKSTEESEKMIAQLNGQQMNLKLDDKPHTQNLMLSIPFSMDKMLGDVKVFIKSKQDNLKADWRNFNMFFVLDTKRFGEVGIKVAAVDKNLTIEIKNDDESAKTIIQPLVEDLGNYVENVGFNVASINFDKLLGEHPNKINLTKVESVHKVYPSERGFDFQI